MPSYYTESVPRQRGIIYFLPNYLNQRSWYNSRVENSSISDNVRRRRPQGIELLFNGEAYNRQYNLTIRNTIKQEVRNGDGLLVSENLVLASQLYSAVGDQPYRVVPPDLTGRLLSQIKNQKVNLAMSLAEYRQTASLFSDVGKRVADAWKAVRRGDPRAIQRALGGRNRKRYASNWLQFQYGVRPLVGDLYASMDLLADRLRIPLPVRKVEVTATTLASGDSGTFGYSSKPWAQSHQERWLCYYTVTSEGKKLGTSLGFTNPLLLAWELVPYSFVIDWFVNVGEVLGSLDALSGVDRSVLYKTIRRQHWHSSSGVYGNGDEYYGRQTYRQGPLGVPSTIRLIWNPSLSWQRITSAVALLRVAKRA